MHDEVLKELKENEQYKYILELNEDCLKEIKISLDKMISLDFNYPSSHLLEQIENNRRENANPLLLE